MNDSFDKAMAQVFIEEGWKSSDSAGGLTIWGIAERYYPMAVKIMSPMSEDDSKVYAAATYRRMFWTPMGCDDLPFPLDCITFDTAINPGPSVARRILNQTKDWREFLFYRMQYYADDVRANPKKLQYFHGWINRCLGLWQKYKA